MPGAVVWNGLPVWQANLTVDNGGMPRIEVFLSDRAEPDAVALGTAEGASLDLRSEEIGDWSWVCGRRSGGRRQC
jgi:hypothetical protein